MAYVIQSENAKPWLSRKAIHEKQWTDQTTEMSRGYTRASIVIIPQKDEDGFKNLIKKYTSMVYEKLDSGNPFTKIVASMADVRKDISKYNILKKGEEIVVVNDISSYWEQDFVTYILDLNIPKEEIKTDTLITEAPGCKLITDLIIKE